MWNKLGIFKLSDAALQFQIDNYPTLKITKSYRGISVLIVGMWLFYLFLMALAINRGPFSINDAIWEIVIFVPILYFVYKGSRLATIILIIVFSVDRLLAVYLFDTQNLAGAVIRGILVWLFFMNFFSKALQVENARTNQIITPQDAGGPSKYCVGCGYRNDVDSNYCVMCGVKIATLS